MALATRAAYAQDAPSPPPPPPTAVPDAPPSAPPDAPATPPSDAPPSAPPDAPATPPPDAIAPSEQPVAPVPAPPSVVPAPSVAPVPKTGSASFEPPPAAVVEPSGRARKPTPVAEPSSEAAGEPVEASEVSPPSAVAPTPPSVAPADSDKSDDGNGVFGPFRIGFLVGGGLPDLVSLGGMIKVTRFFGAGINVGVIPTVHISYYGDATLAFQEYDVYGRIFPFGGAFFLGAGVGYATVRGSLANQFDLSAYHADDAAIPASLSMSSQASVRTLVLLPQIGLLHTFGSGFTIGADVGAQVPIAPSQVDFTTQVPSDIPAQIREKYVTPNDQKVRSSLDKIGRTPIPTIGIKFGWLL